MESCIDTALGTDAAPLALGMGDGVGVYFLSVEGSWRTRGREEERCWAGSLVEQRTLVIDRRGGGEHREASQASALMSRLLMYIQRLLSLQIQMLRYIRKIDLNNIEARTLTVPRTSSAGPRVPACPNATRN